MTENTDIRPLDEETVARIAAGEVVERPASAVKELVENSIDADASRIDVAVEAGGTESIRVADDGEGMSEADLRAAVRQHTTSKIASLDDLESGVATLGFRGEALHTIGAVSRLTIESRSRGADGAGTKIAFEGGEVVSVEPTGCPEGTSVTVEDLFFNTPARRKFLKTTATEFAHVNRVVTRYALANPDVAVSLSHDGREVFATTGQGDLAGAVLSVYGREVARSMIPVDAAGDELPTGPVESVSGLVSHPETNRSTREYLATYVNGRAVTADAVREGIMGAYGNQLGGDRYPFVVLFLETPGDAVDVNVHPRKREVRFDDDDAVRRQVDAAVESALLEHGLLRSRAPRGRSAPDEAAVDPEPSAEETSGSSAEATSGSSAEEAPGSSTGAPPSRDDRRDGEVADGRTERTEASADRTDEGRGDPDAAGESTPSTDPGDSATPSQTDRPASSRAGSSTRDADRSHDSSAPVAEDPSPRGRVDGRSTTAGADPSGPSSESAASGSSGDRNLQERWASDRRDSIDGRDTDGVGSEDRSRKFDDANEQRTLSGETVAAEETAFDTLPPLRVLGQLRDTYLVCETPDGLALVDQHAADERVNYERLRTAFADDPAAQALASPVELELTAAEAEAFESYREALSRLGFYADRVGDRTVAVTTVPAVLEKTIDPARLRDVLASFVAGDREAGAETVDALADDFLADLACYPSITGNTSLTEGSVVDLLAALDDCENPYSCPHGRPVIVEIDADEIGDRFERDYPGHGG